MAGRSFRQRPVDLNKQLDIVRDLSLLDSAEGLPTVQTQAAVAEVLKEKTSSHDKSAGVKEIPIPGVNRVPTYEIDYLPAFLQRNTYVRGHGGHGYDDPTLVEYDLDVEDEQWLAEFNGEQERLSQEKFETMLWRLDLANADATDKIYAFEGSALAERLTPEACASTDSFLRQDALTMLEDMCPSRDTIRVAVYEYWLKKRARIGRPLIRRLQAPTPLNNQDPFRVFRPREKIHRPQTRRRRENNEDSFQRLQTIGDNIRMAMQLFELVVKRERKKRDMTFAVTDWQQLQMKQRYQPRAEQEAIELEYQNAAKTRNLRRPVGFEKLPEPATVTNVLLDFRNKKGKKRKKLGMEAQLQAVAHLPPPLFPPQPDLICSSAGVTLSAQIEEGKFELPAARQGRSFSCRMGRGGRLIVDRCRPFTWEPLENDDAEDDLKPVHKLPNPFSQWSNKGELATQALARLEQPSTVVKLRLTPSAAAAVAAAAAAPPASNGVNEEPPVTVKTEASAPAPAPKRSSSRQKMAT